MHNIKNAARDLLWNGKINSWQAFESERCYDVDTQWTTKGLGWVGMEPGLIGEIWLVNSWCSSSQFLVLLEHPDRYSVVFYLQIVYIRRKVHSCIINADCWLTLQIDWIGFQSDFILSVLLSIAHETIANGSRLNIQHVGYDTQLKLEMTLTSITSYCKSVTRHLLS